MPSPENEKTAEETVADQKARGDFVGDEEPEVEAAAEVDGDDTPEVGDVGDDLDAKSEDDSDTAAEEVEEVEEVEAAAADDEEEEGEPGAKADDSIMVPKGRLDEVLQKSRAREEELQRRLTAAEDRKNQETTAENVDEMEGELDKLDSSYAELLLEGDLEKASAVRKEWRRKQNDLFDVRLEQRSSLASKQAIESMRFDRQLSEYEVNFPAINPDSESFNQEVANEVSELMGAFEAKGWNPVAALNKAMKYVVGSEGGDAPVKGVDPDIVRTKRKVAARRNVADVAKRSPPDITDKGRDTDKIGTGDGLPDVTKMTPEQFADLSETQVRELRGDTITDQEATS